MGMGIGDWGWGLGIGPNPQSPIPNPHTNGLYFLNKIKFKKIKLLIFILCLYSSLFYRILFNIYVLYVYTYLFKLEKTS